MSLHRYRTWSLDRPLPPVPSEAVELSSFTFHYKLKRNSSVQGTLTEIAKDLAIHNDLHDWDEDLSPDPVKRLAVFAKNELSRINVNKADYMVNFNIVQEVRTTSGANVRRHIPISASSAANQLFPTVSDVVNTNQPNPRSDGPRLAHGRVVEIKEHIGDLQRSSILLLQLFCLRILDEEFTYIRAFIQRHVFLESSYREPDLFQASSPSEQQYRCYKRVTLSFHLPHLLLDSHSPSTNAIIAIDRKFIDYFQPKTDLHVADYRPCLYKAASSVLLTIATPQIQMSREEEKGFLSNPEGLWNVIVVNGNWRMASTSNLDPVEYQTPLAQFIRGICSAVISQRMNILPMVHELNEQLRASEDDSLFDDRQFSKSRMYHWIIKTCHDICSSIQTNLKFLRDFRSNRLPELRNKAHSYEERGLEYWTLRLREEISELDKVQMEVDAFREQVRELRDALHGATALLESRIAVMQGDRVKTLTYLSIAYIPLSTVSSIYSMSVLPHGANLASYFVVLAVILVLTLIAAIILQKNSSIAAEINFKQSHSKQGSRESVRSLIESGIWVRDIIWTSLRRAITKLKFFIEEVNADAHNRISNKFVLPFIFVGLLLARGVILCISAFLYSAKILVWDFPWDELAYAFNLLYRPPASVITPRRFSIRKFVLDLSRFALLPIWLALVLIRGVIMLIGLVMSILMKIVLCR